MSSKYENINIREWVAAYTNNEFTDVNKADTTNAINAGWWDWFCKDSSLANRTKKMASIIKRISSEFLLENCGVFFCNRCPSSGPLYDSISIYDVNDENHEVIYNISIDDKREGAKYALFARSNDFKDPILLTDDVKELMKFLNGTPVNPNLRVEPVDTTEIDNLIDQANNAIKEARRILKDNK